MSKYIGSPIKKRNWTDLTGIWSNSFLIASFFLFLLFISPYAAMGANLIQTESSENSTMTAIAMTIYSIAGTVFLSSFLTHWAKYGLALLLMIIVIVLTLAHVNDNDNAKASAHATIAIVGVVLLFLFVFGYGKDSSSLMLGDSILANYIYKIDALLTYRNYVNERDSNHIGDDVHKNILNKRHELESYLWSSSREDYKNVGTTNNDNFKNLLDSIDRDILGIPGKAPSAELNKIIGPLEVGAKKYIDDFSADRHKFMPGKGKKDKHGRSGRSSGGGGSGGGGTRPPPPARAPPSLPTGP